MAGTPVCGAAVVAVHFMAEPASKAGRAEHLVRCGAAVGLEHFVIADEPAPSVSPGGVCGAEPEDAVFLPAKVYAVEVCMTALELLHHLTGGHVENALLSG